MNDLQVINPHPTILILQSESNLTVPPKQFSTENIYPNNQNRQSSSSLNIQILPEIKSSNSMSLKFFDQIKVILYLKLNLIGIPLGKKIIHNCDGNCSSQTNSYNITQVHFNPS